MRRLVSVGEADVAVVAVGVESGVEVRSLFGEESDAGEEEELAAEWDLAVVSDEAVVVEAVSAPESGLEIES